MVSDGWVSDPNLSEVRFSLFDRLSIEFSKPDDWLALLESGVYRISLKAYEKKNGSNGEVCFSEFIHISCGIVNALFTIGAVLHCISYTVIVQYSTVLVH